MTADDWLSGAHPLDMLDEALGTADPVRMRLFAAEVCRALGQTDVADVLADGSGTPVRDEVRERIRLGNLPGQPRGHSHNPTRTSRRDQLLRVVHLAAAARPFDAARGAAEAAFPQLQRELIPIIQCVFTNPFRPVAFDPEWRTNTAVALAGSMYESRDFAPMPVLADALEDAGCDHPDVIGHCRGPGPHVRGCWVVDLVLNKS